MHAPADSRTDASRPGPVVRGWRAFTRFRRTRPFWGALILAWGGFFVIRPMLGSFELMTGLGGGGAVVYILGGGMIAAAAVSFVLPAQRHFPALMAVMFSVASLPMANLGGWLVGMVLGILGSGMVFAWTPYTDKQLARFAARDAARAQKKQTRRARTATAA